jgi:hypothetical protein
VGISAAPISAAQQWLANLGLLKAPLILSVDDTKITPGLRSYQDGGIWKLGGMHGRVETFGSYEELMEKARLDRDNVADKVLNL